MGDIESGVKWGVRGGGVRDLEYHSLREEAL